MDMHSGGGLKEGNYTHIYIQAPEDEARVIFYNRFEHSPDRVTCTCCGSDYSVTSEDSIESLTSYYRNCGTEYYDVETEESYGQLSYKDIEIKYSPGAKSVSTYRGREVGSRIIEEADLGSMQYGASKEECEARYRTLTAYLEEPNVLLVQEADILDSEREGVVPEQGFVWRD